MSAAEELLHLAQVGWCDRADLDAALVACGGEVRASKDHDYYWHPLIGKPSGQAKPAHVRRDANTGLRSYARRVARAIMHGERMEAVMTSESEPPITEGTEAEREARYRPPTASSAVRDRGEVKLEIPRTDDAVGTFIDEALSSAKAMRSEERSRARRESEAARAEAEKRTIITFVAVLHPPMRSPDVTSYVVIGRRAVLGSVVGGSMTTEDAFGEDSCIVPGSTVRHGVNTMRGVVAAVRGVLAAAAAYQMQINRDASRTEIVSIAFLATDRDTHEEMAGEEVDAMMREVQREARLPTATAANWLSKFEGRAAGRKKPW